jgi:hypothetical protein
MITPSFLLLRALKCFLLLKGGLQGNVFFPVQMLFSSLFLDNIYNFSSKIIKIFILLK